MNLQIFRSGLRSAVGALILLGMLLGQAHAQIGLPPSITVQPVDQVVLNGGTVRFTVAASSLTALSYQWYFAATPLVGATASTLILTGVATNDAGGYYVEVRNSAGSVNSGTALLTVLVSNDVPVAKADAFTVLENTVLTVPAPGVLMNDADVYPGPLTAWLVSSPASGTVSLSTNGSFTYLPALNFNGTDSFTYRITDGQAAISEQNTSGGNKQDVRADLLGAQSFQHGLAGDPDYSIKKVVLRLSKKSDQTNNLNFSIGTGINSGPLAGSAYPITMSSISNISDGASFQNYEIVYASPVGPLVAGTPYYLNLENGPLGRDVYVEYAGSSTYAQGTYYKNGADDGKDMRFEIHELVYSAKATVAVDVLPVNSAPVATNDSITTLEDTRVTVEVLANDYDPEGTPLTVFSASTTNGIVVNQGTNVVFTPATNFYGTAVFQYTLSDGLLSATGSVTVTVTPVADLLVANNDSTNTLEDTTVTIRVLWNDVNIDGGVVTLASVTSTNGVAVPSSDGAYVIFTPATNFNGTTVLFYTITNAAGSSTGRVTVAVSPVNDVPLAVNDSTNTLEDTSVTINVLANDRDVESPLTLTGALTTNGTAVVNGTNVIFRPATNFNGTVLFTYTITDGSSFATGSVTVAVSPVNDAPRTTNNTYTTAEDVLLTIAAPGLLANDGDVDGDPLTAVLVGNVTQGSLTLNSNGSFTYRPNTNFNGSDSFTYRAHDGTVSGNLGTVTINITPVNDSPIVNNDTTNVVEDTLVSIRVLDNDVDPEGTPLTITSFSTTNGTVSASLGVLNFRAATNYNGPVVLSYTASDGTNSATASVTVTVTPAYDPPVPVNDTTNVLEDTSVTVEVLGNDYNPDPRTLTLTSVSTTNGTAEISGPNVIFTPATNFNGTTYFTYSFSDGIGSFTGGVTVSVSAVNDAPRTTNDSYTTVEDTRLTVPAPGLLANDFDVEAAPLTALLVGGVSNGTLSLSTNGSFIYTPGTNFYGTDSFTYRASDGVLTGTLATVTITVTPVNDPPMAVNDTATVLEDGTVSIGVLLNDSDIENSALTITSTSTTNGTALIISTNVVFTPASNFYGIVFFSYTISDGSLTATGGVTVTVSAVNDVPVANPDATNTLEDTSVTIRVLGNDTDVEGSVLSLVNTSTTNGTAVINGTNIVFTPSTNFHGTVVFRYGMWDGTLLATGVVTVVVAPVNDAPLAVSDTYTTPEDVVLSRPAPGILTNDLDVDGDTITALLVSNVTNGLLSLNPDGSFIYTPSADYSGSDSFTYRLTDGLVLGNVSTVTLNITPVVDLLRFVSQERATNGARLTLSGPTASPYVIQASSNITEWVPISTNFAAMGRVVFTDTRPMNDERCFYRALIPPATNMQQNVSGGAKVGVSSGFSGAQSFRHGTNGGSNYGISKIVIRISKGSPVPTDSVVFSIGTGVNAGTVARSPFVITPASVTDISDGATFQNYEIAYPEPVGPFTAGITYYLNFLPLAANNKQYWLERSSGVSTYSGGTFYSGGSDIGRDMRFEIWGQ